MPPRLALLCLTLLLAGCDGLSNIPGLGPDPRIVQKEADSKAIGGACRYGLRTIEECYRQNEKATKAHVFAGWKEMDQYMRENKIDGVPLPPGEGAGAAPEKAPEKSAEAKPKAEAKPAAPTH